MEKERILKALPLMGSRATPLAFLTESKSSTTRAATRPCSRRSNTSLMAASGTVTLSGIVQSWHERQVAAETTTCSPVQCRRRKMLKQPEQVGATDKPDHPAALEDGNPLDPSVLQQAGHVANPGERPDADERRRHDVLNVPAAQQNHSVVQGPAATQQPKPPIRTVLARPPAEQVAIAHHADRDAGAVDHRRSAHRPLEQRLRDAVGRA